MALTPGERKQIYDMLAGLLEQYAPPMIVKRGEGFALTGNTPVAYGSKKQIIPGMFFASVAHLKDSVAFYFFPAYMNEKMQALAPATYKCLKGKTCFHFKKTAQVDEKELHA